MKIITLWINRSKAAYLLLLVPLMLMACDNSLHVVLTNLTEDNISINWQGHHVTKGSGAVVAILTEEGQSESFDICRSYGCLATVTITANSIPEEVFPYEPAAITLYEKTPRSFTFNQLGPISVTLDHYPDPLFPPGNSGDVSEFEMTETDIIFDE